VIRYEKLTLTYFHCEPTNTKRKGGGPFGRKIRKSEEKMCFHLCTLIGW
jgi:hypothetical protein